MVVRSKFQGISDTNVEKVRAAENEYLEKTFPGSELLKYFESFQNTNITKGYSDFEKVFNTTYKKSSYEGKVQEFTDAEVSLIFSKVKELYAKLPHSLAIWDLGVAIYPQTFRDIKAVNDDLPDIIAEKMKYALTEATEDLFVGKVKLNANNSEKT